MKPIFKLIGGTVLGLTALFAGCAGDYTQPHKDTAHYWEMAQPVTVYTPDPLLYETISEAVELWNEASEDGTPYFILEAGPVAEDSVLIRVVDKREGELDPYYGLWRDGEITIKRPYAHEVKLVAHELGHVLGFGHSDDPFSIMCEHVDPDATITPEILDILKTKNNKQ